MRGSIVTRTGVRGTVYYVVLQGRWFRCPGTTRRSADIYRAQLVTAIQGGGLIADEPVPLSAFCERWLESRRADVAPGTWQAYERVLRTMILPTFGKRLLGAISPEDVAGWRTRIARTYAANTVTLAISALRHVFKTAVDWNVLRVSPMIRLKAPRSQPSPAKALTAPQMRSILAACPGPDATALVLLAATGGLRVSEVCAARWEHLDVGAGTYYVAAAYSEARCGVGATKTASSRAKVYLTPGCLAALAAHRAAQGELPSGASGGWMFYGSTGTPLRPQGLERFWRRLLRVADVPPIGFHALRHTCAAMLIDAGAHPKVVQQQLRHASIKMTLDTYGHLFPARQASAVAALDDAYGVSGDSVSDAI